MAEITKIEDRVGTLDYCDNEVGLKRFITSNKMVDITNGIIEGNIDPTTKRKTYYHKVLGLTRFPECSKEISIKYYNYLK